MQVYESALIEALQTVVPALGVRVQRHLTDNKRGQTVDSSADLQLLLGVLLIDIRALVQQPLVLVLDGYECIDDPAVHDALDYLLRRMPDALHVVVSSVRTPPLFWIATSEVRLISRNPRATMFRAEVVPRVMTTWPDRPRPRKRATRVRQPS